MCFTIHPKYPDEQTAEQDITCYKYGYMVRGGTAFQAPFYQLHTYVLGERQRDVQLVTSPDMRRPYPIWLVAKVIQSGYHSYSDVYEALKTNTQLGSDIKKWYSVVRCVIPKGSKYYYNPLDNTYVSSNLVVQEFLDLKELLR